MYNDHRGRLTSYTATAGGTSIYSLTMNTYAPNSDVLSVSDSANGNWNYAYDAFNRLTCSNLASNGTCASPTSGTPTYTYVYDRFGNRWEQNGPYHFSASFTGNNPANPQNNNRMDGYSYDAAGNMTSDPNHTYFYDAENRLIQVDGTPGCSGATACYTYDALGRRVQKAASTTECTSYDSPYVDYLYDLSGRPILFTTNGVNQCHDELYAGGRHLATYEGGTKFTHADWQGTERVRGYGTWIAETCTSNPFGDGLNCTVTDPGNPGASPLHFTGKERDVESGLDNFGPRYLQSIMGRFTSADPGNAGADARGPQSWNAYAYVSDNPLNRTDPTGLTSCDEKTPVLCLDASTPPPPSPDVTPNPKPKTESSKPVQYAKGALKVVGGVAAVVVVATNPEVGVVGALVG